MANIRKPFEAYKGTAPYIFVSYAHKDSDKIFPIISEFHNLGFPIWYDEGIDPGNEWTEEISRAILNCSLFIVFISSSSVKSKNVNNEIYFALSKEKKFIPILLEETTLEPRLEMQIGSIQHIKYNEPESEEFYNKCQKAFTAFNIKMINDDGAVYEGNKCIPDKTFMTGSPANEPEHRDKEVPRQQVKVWTSTCGSPSFL
jgi:hypothetical protein